MHAYRAIVCSLFTALALGCSRGEPDAPAPAGPAPTKPAPGEAEAVYAFEQEVKAYIEKFPYQETFERARRYTGGDPAKLNTWVLGAEPALVEAGEEAAPRMSRDLFRKMAFVDLTAGPVILESNAPTDRRLVALQLMDDHNVNYRNVLQPAGRYTLHHGDAPEGAEGERIQVPTTLSVVIVLVEVKDEHDAEDLAAAERVFEGITIAGPTPSAFPEVDVLGGFSGKVAAQAHRQLDRTFELVPFAKTVVGPGQEPGRDVPFLHHSAGTKASWGGPDPSLGTSESIFHDAGGEELRGSNGPYIVTTTEPPVDGFWSLTVYDTDRGGFLHPNDDARYHINKSTVVQNDDGTVTFTFTQHCGDADLNCLEVPAGRFDLVARYTLPAEDIRSGAWALPKPTLRE